MIESKKSMNRYLTYFVGFNGINSSVSSSAVIFILPFPFEGLGDSLCFSRCKSKLFLANFKKNLNFIIKLHFNKAKLTRWWFN